jgi:putative aldouronate transport system permease protein
MNAFGVILVKNYFSSNVPPELIEAAEIDGAGEFKTFFQIVMPLSLPIMATIGLMTGISYWNDWTNGMYYLTDQNLFSLQNVLNRILTDLQFLSSSSVSQQIHMEMPSTGIRMAIAVIGVVPIMLLYPFFQRYFVKGITIGAVKG